MRYWLVGAALAACCALWARAERFVLAASWSNTVQSGEIRRYRLDGTLDRVFVAPRTAGMSFPDGMAWGADNNLYVSDADNARVLKFNGTTGASMGVFASQGLTRAGYCAFGPDGNLYVCSNGDNAVHRYNPTTGAYLGAFATASGSNASMSYPAGIAWSGNTMYVSGFASGRVYKFNATTGQSLGAIAPTFTSALTLRFGPGGLLYVADYGANAVKRYNPTLDRVVSQITNAMAGPVGQTVLPTGELLVTEWNSGQINKYNQTTGAFLGAFASGFPNCNDILVTPDIVIPAPAAAGFLTLLMAMRRRR